MCIHWGGGKSLWHYVVALILACALLLVISGVRAGVAAILRERDRLRQPLYEAATQADEERGEGPPLGHVYFIRSGPAPDGLIKIGATWDPHQRLRDLQVGSSEQLTLLAVMPGDTATEAHLHRAFAHPRVRGEWFRPTPELLRLIAEAARRRP